MTPELAAQHERFRNAARDALTAVDYTPLNPEVATGLLGAICDELVADEYEPRDVAQALRLLAEGFEVGSRA